MQLRSCSEKKKKKVKSSILGVSVLDAARLYGDELLVHSLRNSVVIFPGGLGGDGPAL